MKEINLPSVLMFLLEAAVTEVPFMSPLMAPNQASGLGNVINPGTFH